MEEPDTAAAAPEPVDNHASPIEPPPTAPPAHRPADATLCAVDGGEIRFAATQKLPPIQRPSLAPTVEYNSKVLSMEMNAQFLNAEADGRARLARSRSRRRGSVSTTMWDSQAYLWPFEPPGVRDVSENFEKQHATLCQRAERSLIDLHASGGSDVKNLCRYRANVWELRANRFVLQPLRMRALVSPRQGPLGHTRLEELSLLSPRGQWKGGPWSMPERVLEQPDGLADGAAQVEEESEEGMATAPVRQWTLVASIWGPRPKTNDSVDYYDSNSCFVSAFEEDFRVAFADGRVMRAVAKAEKALVTAAVDRQADDAAAPNEDEDEDKQPTNLDALKAALQPYICLFYRLFKFYAAVGTQNDPSNNASIQKVGFTAFVDTCRLDQAESEHCTVQSGESNKTVCEFAGL